MKPIMEYTSKEYWDMLAKEKSLYKALEGHRLTELFTYTKNHGYATYVFSGTYTDALVELLGRHPDSDEIIILVDGGFNNFGALCVVNTSNRTFNGHVNID